jgi:voltage-gated potassium channel
MNLPETESPEAEGKRTSHGLRRIRSADDSYGFVLVALLATLIIMGVLNQRAAGGIIVPLMFLMVFFLTMVTSGVPRRTIIVLTIVAPIVLAVAGVATAAASDSTVRALASAVSAALVIACVFFIFRRLSQHVFITRKTILGSLCVYLFAALLFALLYRIIGNMSGEPFFVQTDDPSVIDYTYFSFIAMATVGFGDFTPATDVGKMVVIVEAILGQLYLVVVVALFVSRIGRRRLDRTP